MKEFNTYRNNEEGTNLSKSLRVNPFILPDHYFENLARATLFSSKRDALKQANSGFIVPPDFFEKQALLIQQQVQLDHHVGHIEHSGFTVPDHYFKHAADQMQSLGRIDDLRNAEPDLPQDYFKQLSARIIDRVQASASEDTELPEVIKGDSGFVVPDTYFQRSAEDILSVAVSDNLKSLVPQDGFTVPDQYFRALTEATVDRATEKVIPIARQSASLRRNKSKVYTWMGSAAAACVAVVLGINFYQNDNSNEALAHQTMALQEIPEEEIINYLSNYSDPSDLDYYVEYIYQPEASQGVGSGIDAEDLEDYLNYTL